VSAEFLKLQKRRGLVTATLLLTVLPMIVAYGVLVGLHLNDPVRNGAAGGVENFVGSMDVLTMFSVVAAILVGATLGTGDLGAGVFRELVMTGRSRVALFAARAPAGLGLLVAIVGGAFAITATASTVLAGSEQPHTNHGVQVLGNAAPDAGLLLESAGWLALSVGVSFALALGVSSLFGSRGTSIGILLGFWLVAMPLLYAIGALGTLRQGLPLTALEHFRPGAFGAETPVPMSPAAATAVLLAWTVVPLAAGTWRTCTRDA
jgi:hypothetical protein